jgi:hypothetical protein
MYDTNKSRPSRRVAITALGQWNSFAEHRDLAGCLACTPSTTSHVTSGTLKAWQLKENAQGKAPAGLNRKCSVRVISQTGTKRGWRYFMSPTITECLEHARQCEWYAARTNDEEDRKFLLRRAQQWTKLAREKELEVRASARAAA